MKTATRAFIDLVTFLDGSNGINLLGDIKVHHIAQGEVCVECRYFLDKGPQDESKVATWYSMSLEEAFEGLHKHLQAQSGADLSGLPVTNDPPDWRNKLKGLRFLPE